jgi:riboflavin biosynthesis pyrimidine reductase
MSSTTTLAPFDVLYEDTELASGDLPDELGELYGGGLGFEESRVYANFVATLEGAVAVPSLPRSNALIGMENEADRFLMGLLRALADAVLIGSGVLRASPEGTWLPEKVYPHATEAFAELRRRLGKPSAPEVAILTGSGSIDPSHPVLGLGAVVLTSSAGAERLEAQVPEAATVVALGDETIISGEAILGALRDRGHALVLSEAGPHTFGTLLADGLVDELFLTVSPLLLGDAGAPRFHLVEAADLLPHGLRARVSSIRRHGDHLFLRYDLGAGG